MISPSVPPAEMKTLEGRRRKGGCEVRVAATGDPSLGWLWLMTLLLLLSFGSLFCYFTFLSSFCTGMVFIPAQHPKQGSSYLKGYCIYISQVLTFHSPMLNGQLRTDGAAKLAYQYQYLTYRTPLALRTIIGCLLVICTKYVQIFL